MKEPTAHQAATTKLRELLPFGLVVFLAITFVFAWDDSAIQLENATAEKFVQYGRRNADRDDLAFIAVDPASQTLDQLFPEDLEGSRALTLMQREWPWPRSVHAIAIEQLLKAGARVVVIDINFVGPKEGDSELQAVLERYPNQIVIGTGFDLKEHATLGDMWAVLEPPKTILKTGAYNDRRVGFTNFFAPGNGTLSAARFRTSISILKSGELRPDEPVWHSLAARTLEQIGEAKAIPPGFADVPFRYSRSDAPFTKPHPFYTLFVPDLWKSNYQSGEFFKNKIVLIGPYGEVFHDYHQTPIGRRPGPEIHLHVIAAALNGEFYKRSPLLLIILLNAAAACLALLIASNTRRPVLGLAALLAGVGLYAAFGWGVFNYGDLLLPVLPPVLSFYCAGLFSLGYEFAKERVARARMRRMLDRYVSRNVVKELVDNPGFLEALGGSRKCMTVLFSDVRGFTSMSEGADPVALVQQLNEYFEPMVDIVFKHNGSFDKFIGDAVMARWGDLHTEGPAADARSAVAAALEMRSELKRLNEKWEGEGKGSLSFGVGVHQGDAIFGNIGSEKRMEITVIGDAVNVASRLEGLSKHYKSDLLISESVANHIGDDIILRFVDFVRPPGKKNALKVYHVVGFRGQTSAEDLAWLSQYQECVELYRKRQYAEASAAFSNLLAEKPGDPLCAIYIERCERFAKEPPPPDWDGAETRKEK